MIITIEEYELARVARCIDSLRFIDCVHLVCRHFIKSEHCQVCPIRAACAALADAVDKYLLEQAHTIVEKARLDAERNGGFIFVDTETVK